MLQDLLVKVLKTKVNMSNSTFEKLIRFLQNYKIGMYIYPSVIKNNINIKKEEIYKILTILEKEKILKSYYEISCRKCGRKVELVEKLKDISEEVYCEDCEENIDILSSTKMIFKVMK